KEAENGRPLNRCEAAEGRHRDPAARITAERRLQELEAQADQAVAREECCESGAGWSGWHLVDERPACSDGKDLIARRGVTSNAVAIVPSPGQRGRGAECAVPRSGK